MFLGTLLSVYLDDLTRSKEITMLRDFINGRSTWELSELSAAMAERTVKGTDPELICMELDLIYDLAWACTQHDKQDRERSVNTALNKYRDAVTASLDTDCTEDAVPTIYVGLTVANDIHKVMLTYDWPMLNCTSDIILEMITYKADDVDNISLVQLYISTYLNIHSNGILDNYQILFGAKEHLLESVTSQNVDSVLAACTRLLCALHVAAPELEAHDDGDTGIELYYCILDLAITLDKHYNVIVCRE